MILTSKNNYFFQSRASLDIGLDEMILLLEIKRFTTAQQWYFIRSYEFFCKYPSEFDGATMSQDLIDILAKEKGYNGLELAAMLHDWIYVFLKANLRVATMRVADYIMRVVMVQQHKSGIEIVWRLARLAVIRRPFAVWKKYKAVKNDKPCYNMINELETAFAKA